MAMDAEHESKLVKFWYLSHIWDENLSQIFGKRIRRVLVLLNLFFEIVTLFDSYISLI